MAEIKQETERNEKIVDEWKAGRSAFSLAREHDMSQARVQQIIGRVLMREFRANQKEEEEKEPAPEPKKTRSRSKKEKSLIPTGPSKDEPLFSIEPEQELVNA